MELPRRRRVEFRLNRDTGFLWAVRRVFQIEQVIWIHLGTRWPAAQLLRHAL